MAITNWLADSYSRHGLHAGRECVIYVFQERDSQVVVTMTATHRQFHTREKSDYGLMVTEFGVSESPHQEGHTLLP
jgi:hypothetical protein